MENTKDNESTGGVNRRGMLKTGLLLAGSTLLTNVSKSIPGTTFFEKSNEFVKDKEMLSGRRQLGKLQVSSVGIGVQNMSRNYQTTIPTRTEMHNIIRTAYDRGLTFYDAAEAYGPHEVEEF